MSRRTLLLILVLAVLGTVVAWIATRGPDEPASADGIVATSAGPADAVAPAELAVAERASTLDAPLAPAQDSASPRSIAEPTTNFDAFPADALWIEGRVEFPLGTPRDARVFVIATGKKLAGKAQHRFEVDANGRFRAAFAADTKSATLGVDARYLFVRPAVRVDPRAAGEVVLAPKLGGLARVRVVPSAMAATRNIDFAKARVRVHAAYFVGGNAVQQESAACDAHGVAELGGLDPASACYAMIELPGFASASGLQFTPKPGEIVDVDLPIVVAARFAGVVLDERGAPLPRASIETEVTTEAGGWAGANGSTDKAGRFEVFQGNFGTAKVLAKFPGRLPANAGPFEITEGFERADLELRLADGLSIEGVVRWPDGRPVDGAAVSLGIAAGDENAQSERAAQDGTFRFTGLVAETKYSLSSRERGPTSPETPKSDRAWWTALRADVLAGARGIELLLESGNELRGRVVDDLGAAARGVTVAAEPTGADASVRRSVRVRANDEDGTFVLAGVGDGEWNVGAARKGEEAATLERVVLPRDAGRALRLLVPRTASIAGSVLDVDGTPAAGASVIAGIPNSSGHVDERDVKVGADGTFRMERVPAGKIAVRAGREDRAESAELELVIVCGAEVKDAQLQLRRGGAVEGRVQDSEDRPIAGASVAAHLENSFRSLRSTTTRSDGTYRLEGVAPGTVRLFAHAEAVSMGDNSKTVLVVEDASVRADFGGRPQGRILVRGVVHAAKPIAGARVSFWAMDGEDGNQRTTETDANGRYEVRLVSPGKMWITVDANSSGNLNRTLEIPDVAEHVIDFDLGSGRIAGRVLGPEGKPVARATVQAMPSNPGPETTESAGGFAHTEADGAFAFSGFSPGTYKLVVEPPHRFDRRDSRPDLAPRTVSGIVLEAGSSRTDLEIRLERGARLTVRVTTSDGRPAVGAEVRSNAPGRSGRAVRTDAAGVAQLADVPPGEVTVQAWTEFEMTREPVRAVATTDASSEVAVQLVVGGGILLRFVRKDGTPVLEPWTVQHGILDPDHKPVHGEWRQPREGGALPKGPLPPGRYEVWAKIGASESRMLAIVTAGAELEVTLREPD